MASNTITTDEDRLKDLKDRIQRLKKSLKTLNEQSACTTAAKCVEFYAWRRERQPMLEVNVKLRYMGSPHLHGSLTGGRPDRIPQGAVSLVREHQDLLKEYSDFIHHRLENEVLLNVVTYDGEPIHLHWLLVALYRTAEPDEETLHDFAVSHAEDTISISTLSGGAPSWWVPGRAREHTIRAHFGAVDASASGYDALVFEGAFKQAVELAKELQK